MARRRKVWSRNHRVRTGDLPLSASLLSLPGAGPPSRARFTASTPGKRSSGRSAHVRPPATASSNCPAAMATDQRALRPGRREPRPVKRRPKEPPLLTEHGHRYHEIKHRSAYRKRT